MRRKILAFQETANTKRRRGSWTEGRQGVANGKTCAKSRLLLAQFAAIRSIETLTFETSEYIKNIIFKNLKPNKNEANSKKIAGRVGGTSKKRILLSNDPHESCRPRSVCTDTNESYGNEYEAKGRPHIHTKDDLGQYWWALWEGMILKHKCESIWANIDQQCT